MPNLIKLRKGTAAQWASTNPILASGEAGFELDTLRLKIGDGTTSWSNLNYVSFDGGNLDELQEGSESSTSSQATDCSSFIDCDPINGYKYSSCENLVGHHVYFDCQTCECVATPTPK